MKGKMDCFGLTDPGKVLALNQDQFLIAGLNKSMLIQQTSLSHEDHTRLFGGSQGHLLLVADGTGPEGGGKRASGLAVETLARYVLNTMPWFLRLREGEEDDLRAELRAALEQCQHSIETATEGDPDGPTMGTTLTLAYLFWPRLFVVHAGDSRCYLLRGGRLEQITRDHTLARGRPDGGPAPAGPEPEPRWSDVVYSAIGRGTFRLNPDVYKAALHVGDTLLLCTDGLTKRVADGQIRDLLGRGESAEQTCRRLIDAANAAGGPDNITVVVAHFRDAREQVLQVREEAVREESPRAPTEPERKETLVPA